MVPIFVLFSECIFPSATICVRYRAFYEVAFYERLSKIVFGAFSTASTLRITGPKQVGEARLRRVRVHARVGRSRYAEKPVSIV